MIDHTKMTPQEYCFVLARQGRRLKAKQEYEHYYGKVDKDKMIPDVKIKIQLLPGGKMPEKAHSTDADFDVFARLDEPLVIGPGERKLIPAGFIAEIPDGWRIKLESRSGLALKHGVLIGAGVIDSGYANEICVLVHNTNPAKSTVNLDHDDGVDEYYKKANFIVIAPGMKIAQFAVEKVYDVELVEVKETNKETDRSVHGFGSTGT